MAYGSVNVPGARMATLGTDGKLDAAQRPSLAEIKGGSGRNLIINWYLGNSVNRNGKKEYAGRDTFAIDNWKTISSSTLMTVENGYLAISRNEAGTSGNSGLYQIVKHHSWSAGEKVILSALVRKTADIIFGIQNGNSMTASIDSEDWTLISGTFEIQVDSNELPVMFHAPRTTPFDILAVKLEVGNMQTLARQNTDGQWELIDPPDYDLQYALCSQYSPITGEWVGSQHTNENLLINGDFRQPVNRNGKAVYSENGYTIDKWDIFKVNGTTLGTLTIEEDGLLLQAAENQSANIVLDYRISKPYDAEFTFSVLVTALTGPNMFFETPGGTIIIESPGLYCVTSTNWVRDFIRLYNRGNAEGDTTLFSAKVKAVKMELGAQQTLARQNESGEWELIDPPDYALQYALCCQYSPITGEFVGSRQSNENLLDNWYFANKDIIINQRNQIEYIGQFYTIDRWVNRGANTKITLQDDGIKYTFGEENGGFNQSIENPKKLVGKTVTCSILIDENTNDSALRFGLSAAASPYLHSSVICASYIPAGATGLFSVTGKISGSIINDTRPYLNFGILKTNSTGSTLKIQAAKLELGSVQTLAHKEGETWVLNDPPPNKAQELAKCQRYQLNLIAKDSTRYSPIDTGLGTVDAKGFASFEIGIPTTLRAAPTVSFTGKFNLTFTDGTKAPVSNITSNYYNSHVIGLKVFSDSTLTPRTLCGLWTDLPDDGMVNSIMLDANL